jgi:signal peptidase II
MKKFLLILFSVVLCDQVLKWWASRYGVVSVNAGVSFGLGTAVSPQVITIVIAALFAVIVYVGWRTWLRFPKASGLFIGGAISNIIDRLVFGGVRDWLSLPGTGLQNNLADWAIGLGMVMLLLHLERERNVPHK